MSSAYLCKLSAENVTNELQHDVESLKSSMSDIARSLADGQRSLPRSFADTVKLSSAHNATKFVSEVILTKGKSLPIDSVSQVIIGPKDELNEQFKNPWVPKTHS